ncbi:MAG TPA: acetate/propionate family kinase [Gaiellaceae bacterium]
MGPILVVNAGSTSLKLSLVSDDESARAIESFEEVGTDALTAVAHRVVHGGARFRDPVVIEAAVETEIRALEALAPLHNAPAVAGIEQARRALPDVPHVAVFDTFFHRTIPEEAAVYAIPRTWREEWGIRRYGFHGLSVEWCAERVPILLGRPSDGLRLVVCHLGGGCSVTAVRNGQSVDTTMGFSPLEGIPMTTRSGSLDPGALLYVLREHGLDADALDRALNFESGIEGLAPGAEGMREIEQAASAGDPDAKLALDVFVHRLVGAVAAMAAAGGGLDALAFTAGIGENSALVRARACERLAFLGVDLDAACNEGAEPDCDVAAEDSRVRAFVIHAREDLVAARAARALLDDAATRQRAAGR